MQEFSETHRRALNTFHLPLWKHTFDVLSSLSALIILSPLLTGTAIAIRLESKGKAIYKSQRVDSSYRVSNFLKFRSMYTGVDERLKELNTFNQYQMEEGVVGSIPDTHLDDLTGSSEKEATLLTSDDSTILEKDFLKQRVHTHESLFVKIENDPHITRIGRLIRRYSINGLLQLLSALKGDTSIVGNRPLPFRGVELLISDAHVDRFMTLSGLTGLWQVEKRGRAGKISVEERKRPDIRCAQDFFFWLDLKIILRTFIAFM